jgi:hypothetical protein
VGDARLDKAKEDWMTVKEVATLKNVGESAVRLALVTSRLEGQKLGRDWIVNRASAEAWVPQRRGPKRKSDAS